VLDLPEYRLETAENGAQALEKANQLTPDLILLDVMMPGMDGYAVCAALRENAHLREVPILLLTALDDRTSRLNGLLAGADDFLSKPFDPQELRARVQTITRLNRYRTLVEQRVDLQSMAERVLAAQESERTRVARQIYNDIGPALTAHQVQLQSLYDGIPEQNSRLRASIEELMRDTAETFSRLRAIAQSLRPDALDVLGIEQAFEAYCADFARRASLTVRFEVNGKIPVLEDVVAMMLYRLLQESLTNVAQHAEAHQVSVALLGEADEVFLTVQDDGKGMQMPLESRAGSGLHSLEERILLTGGQFSLTSSPGKGVVIRVSFKSGTSSASDQP
jgi:signal transduction histidine kinase